MGNITPLIPEEIDRKIMVNNIKYDIQCSWSEAGFADNAIDLNFVRGFLAALDGGLTDEETREILRWAKGGE